MRRSIAAICLALSVGCATTPIPFTPTPETPRPSPTPGSTLTPAPTQTATTPACLSQPGQIIAGEYVASDLPRSIPYRVYLPPCYQRSSFASYPVLILLHGLLFTDSQWDDLGIDGAADALLRRGAMPPAVIVMPWERKGLDFELAIVEKLLPHIRTTYAGGGDRTNTAIGGLSRGAGWALRIGFKHPDQFGAIGLHSPAALAPDLYYLEGWVDSAQAVGLPRLWIDYAERDTSRPGALDLAASLEALGVSFASSSAPGEHTAAYWSSRLEDYLSWYALGWIDPPMR